MSEWSISGELSRGVTFDDLLRSMGKSVAHSGRLLQSLALSGVTHHASSCQSSTCGVTCSGTCDVTCDSTGYCKQTGCKSTACSSTCQCTCLSTCGASTGG